MNNFRKLFLVTLIGTRFKNFPDFSSHDLPSLMAPSFHRVFHKNSEVLTSIVESLETFLNNEFFTCYSFYQILFKVFVIPRLPRSVFSVFTEAYTKTNLWRDRLSFMTPSVSFMTLWKYFWWNRKKQKKFFWLL